MPRAFNVTEEASIREALHVAGLELFRRQGVSKTSIDDLVLPARIAKGSFYKFYPSKEALFFELLETTQNDIRAPLLEQAGPPAKRTQRRFEGLIKELSAKIRTEPMLRFLGDKAALMAIARKVPPEKLMAHQQEDAAYIREVINLWTQKRKKPSKDKVAAHMSLLLMIQHNETMFGENVFAHAEEAVITSFAKCFFD